MQSRWAQMWNLCKTETHERPEVLAKGIEHYSAKTTRNCLKSWKSKCIKYLEYQTEQSEKDLYASLHS